MFLGHYGLALLAKRYAPDTSVAMLAFSAWFLDLLATLLQLAGVEHIRIAPDRLAASYVAFTWHPISHSLLTAAGWALVVAGLHFAYRRSARAALVVGTLVVSHWLLDAVVHVRDLPLHPGSSLFVGAGLWHSLPLTIAVEMAIFALGATVYAHTTRATDPVGTMTLWTLGAALILIFVGGVAGTAPPSAHAYTVSRLGLWLFVAWGGLLGRHRAPASDAGEATPLQRAASHAP